MKARRRVVIGVVCLAVFSALLVGRWLRPYDLESERIAARAAGIPLSQADIQQTPPQPGEDAAPIYERLSSVLQERPLEFGTMGWGGRRSTEIPAFDTDRLRDTLTTRQDVSVLVHEAVEKPHAFLKVDRMSNGWFTYLMAMPQAAQWIRLESDLMSRDGKYAAAVKNDALLLRIATQAAEQPTLMAHRVSASAEGSAMRGFADVLHKAGGKPGIAEAVNRELDAYKPQRDVTRCLKNDALYGLAVIHSIGADGTLPQPVYPGRFGRMQPPPPLPKEPAATNSPYVSPSEAAYLHWMTKFVEACDAPLLKRVEAVSAVEQEFSAASGTASMHPFSAPAYSVASNMVRGLSQSCRREVDASFTRSIVSTAAAILTYKSRSGRYPTALKQVVSPVPIDPRSGRALQYWPTETGFVLRSWTGSSDSSARDAWSIQFQYPSVVSGPPERLGLDQNEFASPALQPGRRSRRRFDGSASEGNSSQPSVPARSDIRGW